MRVRDVVGRELLEMLRFQGVKHSHVAYRQGDRRHRLTVEQADGAPARLLVMFGDAPLHPGGGARNQQGMQARRVAGTLVEQVLQAAANLDRENVRYYVAPATKPEIAPQEPQDTRGVL